MRREFTHGTPCWIELSSSDADAAAKFYTELFGWEAGTASQEAGGYRMLTQNGKNIAGLTPTMSAEQPTAWLTYIYVDDADATAAAVKRGGGNVFVEPMKVMDIGRMSIFADPTGAVLGIWQPRAFQGFDVTDEPGSFCWAEVLTRDEAKAAPFYQQLFGWERGTAEFASSYTIWKLGERMIAGMMQMTDEYFPANVPSHWGVSFSVADTDTLVEKVPALGGTVLAPAMDCPIGRFATFNDPQGAKFSVMQYASPPVM